MRSVKSKRDEGIAYVRVTQFQENTGPMLVDHLRKLRQDEPVIQFAGWTLNVPRRTLLSPSNEDVRLTQFEFELLLTLARNPGCVLSRDSLIDRVGGRDRAPNDRTIDVLVGRIRRKIEANPKDPRIVITVQGVGYVLAA